MFKSRYINDNGRWTQNAVNDGFVDIKDYIGDIKNDEQGISFNGKEMKISDDFEPEKNIEGYQINEAKQDNGEYASWWGDAMGFIREGIAVQEEGEKITQEYLDKGQQKAQRAAWKLGAQKYLREKRGFKTSAWMLEHSLQDNPEDIERNNYSRIAYLINNDKAYLDALDEKIKNSRNGKIQGKLEDVIFKNGDLYYSIHKSDIYVDGYKQENGKWIIKATLSDTYDFTQIMTFMGDDWDEFSKEAGLGTVANDVAFVSQKLGAINPYEVTVVFYTTR